MSYTSASPSTDTSNSGRKSAVEFDQTNTSQETFALSHPKNYLGVPLAVKMNQPAEILIPKELVKMAGEAKSGAEALGLITRQGTLTEIGEEFTTKAIKTYGNKEDAFDKIAGSTHDRFIKELTALRPETQAIFSQYPPVVELVNILSEHGQLTLSQLAEIVVKNDSNNLSDCLISSERKEIVRDSDTFPELNSTSTYESQFTYQFKSLLCHAGILTTPGSDTTNLDPQADIWGLSDRYHETVRSRTLAADSMEGWE